MKERTSLFPIPVIPPKFSHLKGAATQRQFAARLYKDFFSWSIDRSKKVLEATQARKWEREGQKTALRVFHAAAERVPAYRDFLKKNRVRHEKIRTASDFKQVPWVDKQNYLREYPLEALCWDGVLTTTHMVSVSSGSSGQPFFWPRGSLLEIESTYIHELFLRTLFSCHKKKTLFVNAFAMGMYVAGPITLNAVLRVAQKGYPVEVITPGIDIDDLLRSVKDLSRQIDQVIIAGYPPFVKDVIEQGKKRGIKWSTIDVKFLFAGEGFNESWREYVAELAGGQNTVTDFINLYGTADAAILGHETPVSTSLRRLVAGKPEVFPPLFPEELGNRLPTFVQYYPTLRFFETSGDELIFTASAGVPLVRYNIHDSGGIIPFDDVLKRLTLKEAELRKIVHSFGSDIKIWRLPFLYLYGKSDLTVTLYGLNIYPENIKLALEDPRIRRWVTGRFVMTTKYRRVSQDQYLLVNIELAADVLSTRQLTVEIRNVLAETLRAVNAEYNKLYGSIGPRKARPTVKLIPYRDARYFQRNIKQKWTNKGS